MPKIRILPPRKLETRLNKKLVSMLKDTENIFKELDRDIKFRDSITIDSIQSSFISSIDRIDRKDLISWLEVFYKDVYTHVLSKLKQPIEFTSKEVDLMAYFVVQTMELFEIAVADFTKDIAYILTSGLVEGESIQSMTKKLVDKAEIARTRAETIAISQTANANSRFARETFKKLNVKKVTWSSAKDKRVRKCHLARNGTTYNIEEGCYSACDGKHIQTGQEVRCRCAMIIDII